VLVTAQCFAAAPFLATLIGLEDPGTGVLLGLALAVLVLATAANLVGSRILKIFVVLSLLAELIGSVAIGTVLLLFFREQPFSAVFDGVGGTNPALAPMLAAVALIGWSFIGFESAGDIAEECHEPRTQVPQALVWSLVFVAVVVIYAALGLLLAIPDLGAAESGAVADPISQTIDAQLGAAVARPLFALVVLSFIGGCAAVQAAVSRVIFALARDRELPASPWLGRLSETERLPRNAIVASAVAAGVLLLIALSDNAYATLISMATVGFYIAFAFPVLTALSARLRGAWSPGAWNLGRLGLAVNVAAALWVVFEIVNIAWPRTPDAPWYINWGALLMVGLVALLGLLVRGTLHPSRQARAVAPIEPAVS